MKNKVLHTAGCLLKLLSDSCYRTCIFAGHGVYNNLPDDVFISKLYEARVGKKPNIGNPETFTEKIQWMKLYYRPELYTVAADKYAVRDYVRQTAGEDILIPLLGVWDRPEDIDFEKLPQRFVLKCNHNSGLGMYFCTDKSKMDRAAVIKGLKKGLQEDYYLKNREWQYKNIKRKVIAEEYIEPEKDETLYNYKIYCFGGKAYMFQLSADVDDKERARLSMLDMNWERLPFTRKDYKPFEELPPEPENKAELIRTAETLSKEFPFVRVDLYSVDGKVYFSELTFSPGSGFKLFSDEEEDRLLGEMFILPERVENE